MTTPYRDRLPSRRDDAEVARFRNELRRASLRAAARAGLLRLALGAAVLVLIMTMFSVGAAFGREGMAVFMWTIRLGGVAIGLAVHRRGSAMLPLR